MKATLRRLEDEGLLFLLILLVSTIFFMFFWAFHRFLIFIYFYGNLGNDMDMKRVRTGALWYIVRPGELPIFFEDLVDFPGE